MISNKLKLIIVASMLGVSSVFAGSIAGSPHDLSGTANSGVVGTDDNGEICVYCHTPHAANTAFDGAPLWNKDDVTTTFTMYGQTIAQTDTAAAPANPSLACLSCHDGVSAIDSILNAPGSGMGSLSAGTSDINSLVPTYGGNIGGDLGVTTVGNADLSNDHPVSIVYTEGKAGLRNVAIEFVADLGQTAWMGATSVGDLLRGAGNDQVECGSCHDPHNGGNTQGTSTEVNFLRHSNTDSHLCLGCHAK